MDVAQLSTHAVGMHFRKAQAREEKLRVSLASDTGAEPLAEPAEHGNRQRSLGGAWRCFVHQMRTNRLREVAVDYHRLGPEEKQRLQEEGAAGTARAHVGLRAFGPRTTDLRAMRDASVVAAAMQR